MIHDTTSLRVLMISLERGLIDPAFGSGNALERHHKYAERVGSLDIIVLGGLRRSRQDASSRLSIHATGVRGFRAIPIALNLAKKIIGDRKCSIVVTQDPHLTGLIGYLIKRIHRIPLGVSFHGDFWDNPHWLAERWSHHLYAFVHHFVVPRANGIRCVSEGIKKQLVNSGIAENKIMVIHTPINDELFSQLNEEQTKHFEKLRYKYAKRTIVLYVGRLVVAKNLPFLIDVVDSVHKKIPNLVCMIIGDGNLRSELEVAIKEKKADGYIELLGSMSHSDIAAYYHLSLISLLFSTNESFGKTIIEAGLAGTPTLASASTGAQSIIDDGVTGFIVPINDRESSAAVLEEMLEYSDQTRQLGENARRLYTKRYSSTNTIDRIIDYWSMIAST